MKTFPEPLRSLTTWQLMISQLVIGLVSVLLLAFVIRYPDSAHRPMPQPGQLLLALIVADTVAIITLGGAGVQSMEAKTATAIISTVLVWLFTLYGLIFVWINTYGT